MSTGAVALASARHALSRCRHLLACIEAAPAPEAVFAALLVPDGFSAGRHLLVAAGFSLRATFPLAGRVVPQPGEAGREDVVGLAARLDWAEAQLATLTEADLHGAGARQITHRAGFADLEQSGADYLTLFALPNLWFHVTMAYATLRAAGLPLGKADYDGLHAYPPGFSF